MADLKRKIKFFPVKPGVYIFKNAAGRVLYVGKAASIKSRVKSYFDARHLDPRMAQMMAEASDIQYRVTDSVVEALILEANLIKKLAPKYNIKAKDDKTFLYIWISREKYPGVYFARERELDKIAEKNPKVFGPYPSASSIRAAMDILRKIMPFRTCKIMPKKSCLYHHLDLCPAPCEGKMHEREYKKTISRLQEFLQGKKARIIASLKCEMQTASKNREFEKAAQVRDQIRALTHIKDVSVIKQDNPPAFYRRIEGYDVSGISGVFATGSMVVFIDGSPEKSEYRKFKIKTVRGANDIAMLKEVVSRRLKHTEWSLPDLIIVDGGRAQVNAVLSVIEEYKSIYSSTRKRSAPVEKFDQDLMKGSRHFDFAQCRQTRTIIPYVLGIAKGKDRKKDELIFTHVPESRSDTVQGSAGDLPNIDRRLFCEVRDEAHRFVRGYYQHLHRKTIDNI